MHLGAYMEGDGQVALAQAESALAASVVQAVAETQPVVPELGIGLTPATPATEQTAQVAQPVEAQPEGIKPEGQPDVTPVQVQPVTPALPDTPEFKKALEIYGGDLNRAAQGFLETNTRAAQMAAKLREVGIDPKTMQPYPRSVEVPTAEQTLQAPNPVQVEGYVRDILQRDAVYGELTNQWNALDQQKQQVLTALDTINGERQRAQWALQEPAIIADSFRKEEIAQQLRDLDLKEVTLQNREVYISGKQQQLNDRAYRRSQAAYESVTSSLHAQAEEQASQQQLAAISASAEAEWSTAFPVALEMAMKQYAIPPELGPNLANRVKAIGLSSPEPVEDIHGFVRSVAAQMHTELDTFHRLKATEYGKQAAVRSGLPPSTANTVARADAPSQQFNMAQHEADLASQIAEGLKGYSF